MSLVTITQTVPEPPIQVNGDNVFLRVWYTQNFTAGDGVTPIEGGNGQNGFYYNIECSKNVDDEVVIPAFAIQATTLSNPTANFFGQLYINGAPNRMIFGGASGWQLPTLFGASINYGQLALYNRAKRLLYPPNTYLTADDVLRLINQILGDNAYAGLGILGLTQLDTAPDVAIVPIAVGANNNAGLGHRGITALSVPPLVDTSPIAVGDNDPRITSTAFVSSSYASLRAAVVAIGSTPGTLLVIAADFPSGISSTVPETLVINWGTVGTLLMANGVTSTIESDTSLYPERELFSNALAGEGTVSFSTNTEQSEVKAIWWADGDWGDKAIAALASLPSTGGRVVDTRNLTGAQSLSASITISKPAVTLLLGEMTLSMGTHQFIVQLAMRGVSIIGAVPWGGGAPANITTTTAVTKLHYAGTDWAIEVGTTAGQTADTLLQDLFVYCSDVDGKGIAMFTTLFAELNRLVVLNPLTFTSGSSTQGIRLEGGLGTGTTYGAFNQVKDCLISGFFFGIVNTGLGLFSSNDNHIIRGAINVAPGRSGTIGVNVNEGSGVTITGTDIEQFDVGIRLGGDTMWSAGWLQMEVIGTYLIDIEAGSDENYFIIRKANLPGTGTRDWRDLGAANTVMDGTICFNFDGTFATIGTRSLIPLQINSADGTRKLAIGDLNMIIEAGDNGGNGQILLNADTGTGGVYVGDGAGDHFMLALAPSGIVTHRVGNALTVSSNTITPIRKIHHVGAGLIKTITVPNFLNGSVNGGTIEFIPDAAFTYDATGNIVGTGTAVIGRLMTALWDPVAAKWYMSY